MSHKRSFLDKVEAFSRAQNLFLKDATYIVALSGGADSVALLLSMRQMGMTIEAATCNFNLRGEESDRDEKFCISLCERLNIKIHIAHFDTKTYAELHHVSIEMAARELRYDYFERLRRDINAAGICVAHHRDDSIETLLINLIRGTGVRGLRGIVPKNGYILRPLLCVSRQEIEDFLDEIGQNYVTDSTNLIDDVMRNKVRLDLLPMLEEINPSVRENIFATSLHVNDALDLLDWASEKYIKEVLYDDKINIKALLRQPSPNHLLFCILRKHNFTSAIIEQVSAHLDSETGRVWHSETHDLLLNRGYLVLRKRTSLTAKEMKIVEQGTYVYQPNVRFSFSTSPKNADFIVDKSCHCACLDADKVAFPLTIRGVRTGEKFMPFGMKGFKLVSDYLTDKKRTLFDKQSQLVISDAENRIVWLVNERTDERFKVKSTTKNVLKILLHE